MQYFGQTYDKHTNLRWANVNTGRDKNFPGYVGYVSKNKGLQVNNMSATAATSSDISGCSQYSVELQHRLVCLNQVNLLWSKILRLDMQIILAYRCVSGGVWGLGWVESLRNCHLHREGCGQWRGEGGGEGGEGVYNDIIVIQCNVTHCKKHLHLFLIKYIFLFKSHTKKHEKKNEKKQAAAAYIYLETTVIILIHCNLFMIHMHTFALMDAW